LVPIEAPSDHDELVALLTLYSSGSSEPPSGALFSSAAPPGAAIQPVLLKVGSVAGVKDLLVAASNRAIAALAPSGSWTASPPGTPQRIPPATTRPHRSLG
jgi:hypothetical protein